MNKGWECPKCGRCYAPWVRECFENGGRIETPEKDVIYEGSKYVCEMCMRMGVPCPKHKDIMKYQQEIKCFVCNDYHPGIECPKMRVT